MNITMLNGNPDPHNFAFEEYLGRLKASLEVRQHQVTLLPLQEMEIRYCIGCFGCWVKTPGQCFAQDLSSQVLRSMLHSDFTIWASPLVMGYPSAVLKRLMDKCIPLIHPYFVVDHNEAHHRARYSHYPRLGLLLARETDTSQEDIRIVTDMFSRTALNMKSALEFSLLTDQPVEAVVQAITARKGKKILGQYPSPTRGVQLPAPPTRLTIFNGSPRGRKGNTPLLMEHFLKGFTSLEGHSGEIYHLNHLRDAASFSQAFGEAECAWLGFPLYTDAMPGIVKAFIESLASFQGRRATSDGHPSNPPLGFLVQSGFPEAAHSRFVERYLEKLAGRLGSPYLGTIVKGGAEGTRIMPENMTHNLFATLEQLGRIFGETGQLDPNLLSSLAKPERYPTYMAPVFKLFVKLPVSQFYWNGQLKKNGAYERRFDRPLA
jgi:multimeric flavodoxin WrbA